MTHWRLRLSSVLLAALVASSISASRAAAEGAIAVGIAGDVAKDGYALGIAVNQKSEAAARTEALRLCRTDETAGNSPGKSNCRIVQTFHRQCAAEANDPKPGTPGWAWAVGADPKAAEKSALDQCIKRSSADRRDACKLLRVACDSGL